MSDLVVGYMKATPGRKTPMPGEPETKYLKLYVKPS
jgi:hypothetical protein